MIIYLVRHAVAMEREDWDKSDESRPLTDEGIERMTEAAKGLARMGLEVDAVFTSPLTRARQTADILVKELQLAKPKLLDCLAGGYPPTDALVTLQESDYKAVMMVGHEPDMGHLASFFLGTARPVPFKKGAAMAIDFDGKSGQGKGRLAWYMTTKVMRHLK